MALPFGLHHAVDQALRGIAGHQGPMAIDVLLDSGLALLLGHPVVEPCCALNHLAQDGAGLELDVIIADACQSLTLPNLMLSVMLPTPGFADNPLPEPLQRGLEF
jgi:hypothetical protein